MRKLLSLLVCFNIIIMIVTFTACQSSKEKVFVINEDLKQVIDTVKNDFLIPSPTDINNEMLKDIFDIDTDKLIGYYGFISLDDNCIDKILYLHCNKKYTETAVDKLTEYTKYCIEIYKDTKYQELTEKSKIFKYDDYVFLVMAARSGMDTEKEIKSITENFTENLK